MYGHVLRCMAVGCSPRQISRFAIFCLASYAWKFLSALTVYLYAFSLSVSFNSTFSTTVASLVHVEASRRLSSNMADREAMELSLSSPTCTNWKSSFNSRIIPNNLVSVQTFVCNKNVFLVADATDFTYIEVGGYLHQTQRCKDLIYGRN